MLSQAFQTLKLKKWQMLPTSAVVLIQNNIASPEGLLMGILEAAHCSRQGQSEFDWFHWQQDLAIN